MHYIRFLKVPFLHKHANGTHHLTILFTITTDLGESSYPNNLHINVVVSRPCVQPTIATSETYRKEAHELGVEKVQSGEPLSKIVAQVPIKWLPTTREVRLDAPLENWDIPGAHDSYMVGICPICNTDAKVRSSTRSTDIDNDTIDITHDETLVLPPVLGLTTPFTSASDFTEQISTILRPVPFKPNQPLQIREAANLGKVPDPNCVHVWDAACALIPTLHRCLTAPSSKPVLPELKTALTRSASPHLIELGSGTVAVSSALPQLLPNAQILATDRAEARPFAKENVTFCRPIGRARGNIEFLTLDWHHGVSAHDLKQLGNCGDWRDIWNVTSVEKALPVKIAGKGWDVILASDCTYNPDSAPALVRTMRVLAGAGAQARVVVALKRRHESEGVFFGLMERAGFEVLEREKVLCPIGDEDDEEKGEETEVIEIYVFGKCAE